MSMPVGRVALDVILPIRGAAPGSRAARDSCCSGALWVTALREMHRAREVRGLFLLRGLDALDQSDHDRCHEDKGGENGDYIEIADKCHVLASRILSIR
jgi:hypothetical protein